MSLKLIFLLALSLLSVPAAHSKEVVGWIEYAEVSDGERHLILKAKLDTGASSTSINSGNYKIFHRNGEDWVRFGIVSYQGDFFTIEKRIVKYTKIKRHSTKSQVRPVIVLGLCLGSIYQQTEVNLVDRSKFNYQLLVGRKFLKNGILVDSSQTFTKGPRCMTQ